MKGFFLALTLAAVGIAAAWFWYGRAPRRDAGAPTVRVTRGSVARKAMAVGRVEVEHEVPVNSFTGGILRRLFVKAGQKVEAGAPLAEVRPLLTDQALLAAERGVEQAVRGEANATEYLKGEHLASKISRFMLGEKNLERMHDNAVLGRQEAEERLELLKQGQAKVGNRVVDYLVRAPVAGTVLEIRQREGSPVVPASSYGQGTVFITLADMTQMLFRGTVDEIDAGRLSEGMAAQIRVGALPDARIAGRIEEIALKGTPTNNAMVFEVWIRLDAPPQAVLRSGYSAVAELEIERRTNVPTLPERVVEFRGGKAWVRTRAGRKEIDTGLSDGLSVEVRSGLEEGEEVFERVGKD